MPDRHDDVVVRRRVPRQIHRARRAVLAVGVLVGLGLTIPTAGPAAAQASPWADSAFEGTLVEGAAVVGAPTVTVAGVFRRTSGSVANERITRFTVTITPMEGQDLPEGCTVTPIDRTISAERSAPVDGVSTLRFSEDIAVPCNGRYDVAATATAAAGGPPTSTPTETPVNEPTRTLEADLAVNAAPPIVPGVSGDVDDDGTFVLRWEPFGENRPPDLRGYVVQRAPSGADDAFETVATFDVPLEAPFSYEEEVGDEEDFQYVVRAFRRGADLAPPTQDPVTGATVPPPPAPRVLSPIAGSTIVSLGPDDPTSSSVAGGLTSRVRVRTAPTIPHAASVNPRIGGGSGSGTPTTQDTGFGELDYGDDELSSELPGEGQSVIRTPVGEVGLLRPAAGALVLFGWASHLLYLNRLAKQF